MIDSRLEYPWPQEVADAVQRFKQGDLVENPPFFYAGVTSYGIWELTRAIDDPSTDTEVLLLDQGTGEPQYGLITTQTCDLNEQRSRPNQPWIQIAPVYRLGELDSGRKNQIIRHEIGYLVHLTAEKFASGLWVTDLRIEVPVEKSWLVGRDPVEGFTSEKDYLRLAERLSRRRNRPALANNISDEVVRPLRDALRRLNRKDRSDLLEPVEEFRLTVNGNRLQPTSAQLIIITKHGHSTGGLVEWFDGWWNTVQGATEEAGLALIHNRYATLDGMTARDYTSSTPLDFNYLSPDE